MPFEFLNSSFIFLILGLFIGVLFFDLRYVNYDL